MVVSGSELEQSTYTDRSTVNPLMGKIKQLVTEFDTKLSKRKKKLDDSVRLHRLTEAVREYPASPGVTIDTITYGNGIGNELT